MGDEAEDAANVVSRGLQRHRGKHRAAFLRELLHHAAAALEIAEGRAKAAEEVFRLADAMVVATPPK